MREERRLTLFENKVLRRINVPKTEKERREWRKLHNEKHHDMYFSPNIFAGEILSRMKRWEGDVTCVGESGSFYRVGKCGGKTQIGRQGRS